MAAQATWEGINEALDANDMVGAAVIAEAMLATGLRHPTLLNIAAWHKEEQGDFAAAHALLTQALRMDPNDPLVRLSVGAVMRKQGRLDEALAVFAPLEALISDNPAFWLERGYALDAGGALDAAIADFDQAIMLDPQSPPSIAARASALARLGRSDEARAAATRALALDPRNVTALLADARCDFDTGNFAGARDILVALIARDDVHIADRVPALGLLGDAHDRLGAVDAAFSAYSDANASFQRQHVAAVDPDEPLQSAFIGWIGTAVGAVDPKRWLASAVQPQPQPNPQPKRGHAFLLGYPRSGTTLVENILASAQGVEAVEERPTLGAAEAAFLDGGGGIARLAGLDAVGLAPFVKAYWDKVASYGIDPATRLFVDMDPLKGMKLPLIAKLFPDARIIVMRRDPRDVVWSCFHTNFVLSGASREFATLEGAARHYDALTGLTEQCFAAFPLAVHELRYDALISDFDATTQALCAFLDIAWSPDLRAFDKTAARRGVKTASASQVRKGLYDGRQQWQRYETQMAGVMPILMPWVERFGFR